MADENLPPGLASGERLGPYEIVAPLGAGGMGIVYRARDVRLDRPVAIKVMPALGAAASADRSRFQREAKAIAQLQHPYVCALYDVGERDGADFLVMELLDGESLAARLERGALPIDQILSIGAAIAEALAAAHRRGIIHRDLKPGNVMLTKSGPKLLDFGLAKLRAGALPPLADQATRTEGALTGAGTLVGTLAYMAPEQLEGRAVDERADLWALGCVLHEMASGEPAFRAASPASTIAAVLEREPRPLAGLVPTGFDRLVRACLAKDPDERWASAADLGRELRWLAEGGGSPAGETQPSRPGWRSAALLAVALLAGAVAGWRWRAARGGDPVTAHPPARLNVPFMQPGVVPYSSIATLSPDGRRIVASSTSPDGAAPLQLITLGGETAQPLAGTEGGAFAFWSPDSRSVAFFQNGYLRRTEVSGGDVRTLCAISDQGRGGAWSPNGTIVFSGGRRGALFRVPAEGGSATPVTTLDAGRAEQTHRWPQFLPGGERFLYWASDNQTNRHDAVRLGSLAGGEAPIVLEGTTNAIYASGHLVFARWTEGLAAQPFDPDAGKVKGAATPLARDVYVGLGVSVLPVSASAGGDLLYLAKPTSWNTTIGWYDRAGNPTGSVGGPAPWDAPRFSPDGGRIAAALANLATVPFRSDVWLIDLANGERTRLTYENADAARPVWSPDGRRIAYVQFREDGKAIRLRPVDGGADELLLEDSALDNPAPDWSPDGRFLVFARFEAARGNYDVRRLDVATRETTDLLATGADELQPRFSPDGRYLAYASNETRVEQVYVMRLASGQKWQVSLDGGNFPRWQHDGRAILFLGADSRLRQVPVSLGDTVRIGAPSLPEGARPFPVTPGFYLELDPKSDRILADAPPAENLDAKLRLIVNWPGLLAP